MTFSSIIYKNFKYNLRKYIAYLIANAFTTAILFMYGSIMCNPSIVKEFSKSIMDGIIKASFGAIIFFSIIFISYTTISFIKYRGHEFGVYMTLGMTIGDLRKLIILENILIIISSLILGLGIGAIFSKIFFKFFCLLLNLTNFKYSFEFKAVLITILIFLIIFSLSVLFSILYISRLQVIDVIKSTTKKEIGYAKPCVGIIALAMFIIAALSFPEISTSYSLRGISTFLIPTILIIMIVAPYFIISSAIVIIIKIVRRHPRTYNNNLLVLSNLKYRFKAYKNIMYILSLLIAGAIFFIGVSFSIFKGAKEDVKYANPYDITYIETYNYNKIGKDETIKILEADENKISKYDILEFLCLNTKYEHNGNDIFDNKFIVSQSNYNKLTESNLSIKNGEAVSVVSNKKIKITGDIFVNISDNPKRFKPTEDNSIKLTVNDNKLQVKVFLEANTLIKNNYYSGSSVLVISDEYYSKILKLKPNKENKFHLINAEGDKEKGFKVLFNKLKESNSDRYIWEYNLMDGKNGYKSKNVELEALRPLSKENIMSEYIKYYGSQYFSMLSLGSIFLLASCVIVYFKVVSDIDEEAVRSKMFKKIGMTKADIEKVLFKELRIIFLMPVLFGSIMGLTFITMMYFGIENLFRLIINTSIIILAYMIFQVVAYIFAIKKYRVNLKL